MEKDITNEVIVVGDGGHAKVCIDLMLQMGIKVPYCIGMGNHDSCLNIPVLIGNDHIERLYSLGYRKAFIAIGDNKKRIKIGNLARECGYKLVNAISPQACISSSVSLGEGIAIMPGVVINADSVVQDLSIINTGAVVDHDCYIALGAHIGPTCGLAGGVRVDAGAFLGVGCKVIPNCLIGAFATVGAGSVVISNVKDDSKMVGIPAREI